MFENIINFFKNLNKKEKNTVKSKETAKDRLHLVLVQDRANVSADFLDLMRKEIIDVIKKYIEIDDSEIDVQLTNMQKEDGTIGAPVLHANIPIVKIKNEAKKKVEETTEKENQDEQKQFEEQEKNENSGIKTEEKQTVEEDKKENNENENKPNMADDILKEVAEMIKTEENKKNSNN